MQKICWRSAFFHGTVCELVMNWLLNDFFPYASKVRNHLDAYCSHLEISLQASLLACDIAFPDHFPSTIPSSSSRLLFSPQRADWGIPLEKHDHMRPSFSLQEAILRQMGVSIDTNRAAFGDSAEILRALREKSCNS